jgi:hypothetical protein
LKRHGLLPNTKDILTLDALWYLNQKLLINEEFLQRSRKWRGILLPRTGQKAGDAIMKLYESGILHSMTQFDGFRKNKVLKSNGAQSFWTRLHKEVKSR